MIYGWIGLERALFNNQRIQTDREKKEKFRFQHEIKRCNAVQVKSH